MFGIHKNFVKNDYLEILKSEIKFRQDNIKIGDALIKEERQTCWMSDLNYNYKYGYKVMKPDKLTPNIKAIQKLIKQKYGIYYDSILANYYSNGNVGMRYHSDETYNEWYEDTVIVCFGSNRKISFREISNFDNKIYFETTCGDLVFMKEGCQKLYQHRVLKDKSIKKDRISLVFKKHK